MKNFFTNSVDPYDLNMDFMEIKDLLYTEIPGENPLKRALGFAGNPIEGFSLVCAYLEKLFFQNDLETKHTYTSCYNNKPQTNRDMLLEDDVIYKSGISYTIAPSTRYYEIPGSTHLDAAENVFKNASRHFLKISTKNNILFVYSNKDLTFKDFCQLKLLQWTLTKDNFTTPCPEVIKFVQHIANEEWTAANETIHAIFKMEMFAEFKYAKFDKMFQPNHKRQIEALKNSISAKEADYIYFSNEASRRATEIDDLNEQLWVLETREEKKEDNKALLKYLFNHPYIKEVTILSDTRIKLYYESPIVYFDEWIIKKIYKNYSNYAQKIFNIFLKNKYELMTHCAIEFDTNSFSVSRYNLGRGYPYLGHPHINKHGCFGSHPRGIHEAAKLHNYLGAIEQISYATMNVNFSDSTVIRGMCWDLEDAPNLATWRNKETGEIISTTEVIERYENEEATINIE